MMNIPLFFSLLAFLGIASLWLGKKAASQSKNNEDYFLMGRQLGLFSLVMTLLATQIGAGALMGAAQESYTQGWSVIFYPLGMVLGLLVLGLGYGAKIRRLNLTTVAEVFEKIYQAPRLRQLASLLSIVSLFLILVGQAIAARTFFASLGFDNKLLFTGFWLILVLYTVMGGLKAVVNTDILQASFILIVLTLAVIASQIPPTLSSSVSLPIPPLKTAPWAKWLFMPLFFMLIEQDMGQRCFAAKNARTVSLASLSAGLILLLVSLAPIYFGTQAAQNGIVIPEGTSVLIGSVKALTNPTVCTFVICAVLMAIVSTADSLLCSVSSNIASDFPKIQGSVRISQAITVLVGASALSLSFLFDNVVTILMFAYELAVSLLFVPITFGVWMKKPKKISAIASIAAGLLGFLTLRNLSLPVPPELLTLMASAIVFIVSELFQNKRIRVESNLS